MLEFLLPGTIILLCATIIVRLVAKARRRGWFSRPPVIRMLALNSLGLVLIAILSLILATRVLAQEGVPPGQQGAAADTGIAFLAAGLATGLAAIAAGIAVGMTGSAAIGAVAEKPELFGRFLVIVGLAEGIAIYGLIVSILILGRI